MSLGRALSQSRSVPGPGPKLVIFSALGPALRAQKWGRDLQISGGGEFAARRVNGRRGGRKFCVNIVSLSSAVLERKCQEALRQILKMEMKFH